MNFIVLDMVTTDSDTPLIIIPDRDPDPEMCELCFHTLDTLNNMVFNVGSETFGFMFLNRLLMYFRYLGIKLDPPLKNDPRTAHFILEKKPLCQWTIAELYKTFTKKLTNNPSIKRTQSDSEWVKSMMKEGL